MRRISIIVAILALGIPLAYTATAGAQNSSASTTSEIQAPQVGALAPDFTLTDMHGKTVSLSQLRGKVVMVNFWATWCPPCRAEVPSIEQLYLHMKKRKNFVLVAVNVNQGDARGSVKEFLREIPVTFPIFLGHSNRVADRYQVNAIPETFIINRNGTIVQKVEGGRDWNTPAVEAYLSSLLKGE